MNALNLKVTGDTKNKRRKREEKEDLSIFYAEHGESCKRILNSFSEASSLESQISTLKSMIPYFETASYEDVELSRVTTLFFDMILRLNTKSPFRTAILRHFFNIGEPMKSSIQSHLLKFLEEKSLKNKFEIDYINQYLAFLMSWLENSIDSPFTLEPVASVITSYLLDSSKRLHSDVSSDISPTAKLFAIEALHNIVRCLISIFQKVASNPSTELQLLILRLLKDNQLHLDTRSNCGILFILNYKAMNPDFRADELIDTICAPEDFQSLLCLYCGLLNVLDREELAKTVVLHRKESSLLNYLLYKIILVEESKPADCTLVLSSSRCVLLVTKCVVASPHLLTRDMLTNVLNFIWAHLEHFMDAVRHLASSCLTNIVNAGKKLEDKFVFDVISNEMSIMASDKRSKHAAISALIGNLPIQSLLSKSPGLVSALLDSAKTIPGVHVTHRNHAFGSYEALMTQHFEEKSSMDEWYDLWVNPLINLIGDRPNAALDHILGTIVKIDSGVIQYILARLQSRRTWMTEPKKLTSAFLICLRIGKKLGVLKTDDDGNKWKGLLEYDMLATNMHHSSGDVRIASFALITETLKLSEEFSSQELEIVKLFLKYNISNHCAADRQKMLGYFSKFIARFKLGFDSCERMIDREEKKPAIAASKDVSEWNERLEMYKEFKVWLVQFCIDNLFPAANFARRYTALCLLTMCRFWDEKCQTELNCSTLLRCFLDSYEENKNLAKRLLTQVPAEVLKFNAPEYVKWYVDSSIRLAASVRPVDSQSAAYFMALLAAFPSASSSLRSIYKDMLDNQLCSDISGIPDLGRYICVLILLDKLKSELIVARQSLLKAASSGPLYGQLLVLRIILKEADFGIIVDSEEWKSLIQDIISVAYECNNVVSCVVNSSSPEGHLPMDFDYEDLGLKEDEPKVTAQMILLCSWRTVKEVSLLLGELSETIPISTNGEAGLVTEKQILDIGEHLSGLLAETKHRGAFEQAYVGFCKLASRLWRYPKGNLHELPSRWLDETLEEISNNQNLSATRRSAGIPFRFQALVCTEFQMGRDKCFNKCIKTLLELARDSSNSVETKCHALNILRALYRHTLLGEKVSPYVAEGFAIAVQGFNASTWAERNSSTLLLSALMTRVFGVPRSRSENLCWKNKMTGRIFFQRYPSLFEVLLNHLDTASQKSLYPATYPALLILGRLYPSSLEGTDSNLQLNKYIPLVFKCSGSNILKTRTLAASAIVALITPNLFVSHIEYIFNSLAGSLSENFTHGLLLQVLKLFRSSTELPEEVIESIKNHLDVWLMHIVQTLRSVKRSFVTKTTCISILLHWITHYTENIPGDVLRNISDYLISQISSNEPCSWQLGISVFLLYSATLLLTINYYRQQVGDMMTTLKVLIHHSNYDVKNVTLDFLCCLLQDSKCFNLKVDDASNIKFPSSSFDEKLKRQVLNSDFVATAVLSSLEKECHHEDGIALLCVARHLPKVFELLESKDVSTIQYFGSMCEDKPDSLGSLAFECISSSFAFTGVIAKRSYSDIDRLCQLIDMYTTPDCEHSCRSRVAEFLRRHFWSLVATGSPQNNLTIWTSTLRLLNDDDCDIRDTLANAFSPNTLPTVAFEKFLQQLINSSVIDCVKSCLLLQWSLWDYNVETCDDDESTDRIFEKGDMNTYLEEVTINQIVCSHLKSFVNENPTIATQELPDYCCTWLQKESQLPLNGTSLVDMITSLKAVIDERCLNTADQSPFRQNEVNISLLQWKLTNVLNCIAT